MLSELKATEIFACLKYSKSICDFNRFRWRNAEHARKFYNFVSFVSGKIILFLNPTRTPLA